MLFWYIDGVLWKNKQWKSAVALIIRKILQDDKGCFNFYSIGSKEEHETKFIDNLMLNLAWKVVPHKLRGTMQGVVLL